MTPLFFLNRPRITLQKNPADKAVKDSWVSQVKWQKSSTPRKDNQDPATTITGLAAR